MSVAVLGASRAIVKQWLIFQLVIVCLVTLLSLLKGSAFAGAVFIGGMICCIANVVFARSWLSFFSARYPQRMLIAFYFGEIIKFSLMLVLLILAFKFLSVDVLPVLLGFVGAQVGLFLGTIVK